MLRMVGGGTPDWTVSVVVPVYNSQDTLAELVDRLSEVLHRTSKRYELVLVNDGSQDRSWEVISELASRDDWIRGIDLMRNYGQHNALLAGVRAAECDMIVTVDDDLQHPPEEIPKLLAKLAEGYDVVYGTPQKEQHGFWRTIASQATKLALQSVMGAEVARNVSAFRAFRTQLRDAFAAYQSPFMSLDVLLTWASGRFAAVTVRHDARRLGKSNYTFSKLFTHAFNMVSGFSTWPLRLASLVGLTFTAFGALLLVYVLGRYFIEGGSVPGFPFLASAIAIFSGAQLFALGIIGEYLARIHFRMMQKPAYIVRRQIPGGQR